MLKKIKTVGELDELVKEGTWLVDFSAKWCGPCRMLEPVLESVSKSNNVIQIDVDESQELAMKYAVMSIPTLIVFKDGKEESKSLGYRSEEEILKMLNNN